MRASNAPASEVDVEIDDDGAGTLTVSVLTRPAAEEIAARDPTGSGSRPGSTPRSARSIPGSTPGSGTGLVGLAERVALAGGRLDLGPTSDGGYALIATLPT